MKGIFLLTVVFSVCSTLPTGGQGPFILDLTGGAGQPGQVIGQVDGQTGNVVQSPDLVNMEATGRRQNPVDPLVVHRDPSPVDPAPNPSANVHGEPAFPELVNVETLGPLIVPREFPVANPGPNTVVRDTRPEIPIQNPNPSINMGPLHMPVDPVRAQLVRAEPLGPLIVHREHPVANPGPNNVVVDARPEIVIQDLNPGVNMGPLHLPVDPVRAQLDRVEPLGPLPVRLDTLVPANPAAPGLNSPQHAIDWTCEGYRQHPSNTNMYQVFYNNRWSDRSCFGILVWNQTLCSCLVPEPTGDIDPNCPNNRAHPTDPTLYHIKHWGVWIREPKSCEINQLWNQTGCRCDWDPVGPGGVFDAPLGGICDLMFNASFTTSLRDDANYNSIGREPWFNVKTENGTARLDNGRMPVWAFSNNEFGRDFQVQLDFQLDNVPATANRFTTLISNNCDYDRPSVAVGYRPSDQSYRAFFRDTYINSTMECIAPTITPYAFQSISLEYESSRLSLKVNGALCVDSNIFSGEVATSQCPFYFGGDGVYEYMSGNMDNIIVRRYCVNPV